ncbi:hypothetical protein NZ698_17940 [Chryseobacterium sp. PBS4-4]|uniref:DUF3300 domain-containing protein n=1 Tax=Chryseobacterium edaphi TaxID=2976532 RepID=A0ABT2WA28_9FLAO|nr:hypothetical protein [Chryseobacterium edaphi]MCU7619063.1 hypothetical protein [Chryseobacterium edaphi]
MKKILLGFALTLSTLSFAQQYPNNGYNDGYGDNDGYYSDQDDQNYFPDDYYYNYPQDYYPQDYYQSYYNDYRNSIVNVNWNVFFQQNRLNRWQIDQILYLNNLYSSFSNWNNFYRYNPDRWYYDRFYAMERILGPRIFVVFQNNYYRRQSPIAYFQNYRRTYYTPRFRVMPRYRNVNINIYRVDRNSFRRNDNPTLNVVRNSGFRNGNNNNSGGFRNQNNGVRGDNGGFRNSDNGGVRSNGGNNGVRGNDNGGFRNSENGGVRSNNGNNGVRGNDNGGFRNNNTGGTRTPAPRSESNGTRENGGFRSQQRNESSSPRNQNSAPRQQNNRNEGRSSGGFRNGLVSN